MKILALDQARKGAYAIFDYEKKKLIKYGSWNFDNSRYTYSQAIRMIELLVENLIYDNDISAVFIEDIQLRKNVASFKCLAHLQGVLINLFERANILYDLIQPASWQGYCKARGRTIKEAKQGIDTIESTGKPNSKVLSIQCVKDKYHIITDDDNIADSVLIGHYVVNKIIIKTAKAETKEKD